MWHEARKQEKKIRGMLVDYRRRAERRQDFYERIVSGIVFSRNSSGTGILITALSFVLLNIQRCKMMSPHVIYVG